MSSKQYRMTRDLLIFLPILISIYITESCLAAQFMWKAAQPESQGFSVEKLKNLKESLAAKNTKALLIIRNDKIVLEWYAQNHGPTKKHYTASLAKALVGGMSLLTALNDGLITPNEPASKYVPQWRSHPVKSRITIRHLTTHSSGIEDVPCCVTPKINFRRKPWKSNYITLSLWGLPKTIQITLTS